MQRVSTSSAVATQPTPPAGGTPGFFAKPDPANSVAATSPGYAWFNGVQEELMAVIEGQGLTGNTSNNTQLRTAITKMIQAGQRSVVINNAVFAAAVTTGKAVYWDAVNSRFDLALADGSVKQNCIGFADVANGNVYAFGDAVLFAGLAPGRVYLDAVNPGGIVSIQPANAVYLGIAKSPNEIFVDIDQENLVVPNPPVEDNSPKIANTSWIWGNIKSLVSSCLSDIFTSFGFSYSFGTNSYIKFPSLLGGVVLVFGYAQNTTSGPITVTWPTTFPSACRFAWATPVVVSPVGGDCATLASIAPSYATFNRRAGTSSWGNTNWDIYYIGVGN